MPPLPEGARGAKAAGAAQQRAAKAVGAAQQRAAKVEAALVAKAHAKAREGRGAGRGTHTIVTAAQQLAAKAAAAKAAAASAKAKATAAASDAEYAAILKQNGYLPEAHTDVSTRFVLGHLLKRSAKAKAPSSRAELFGCATDLDTQCATQQEMTSVPSEPLLMIVVMPWFMVHTGHIRAWTLLHRLKYPCFFKLLNLRLLVLVQPGISILRP